MRGFAESLIAAVGKRGPIIVYSPFEKTMLRTLIARYPDLEDPLSAIIQRLEDLLPWVRRCYYHPSMQGSFSIKSVLPAVAPTFTYDDLPGIRDGMQAQYAYWRVVAGEATASEVERGLCAYCERDTLALVKLVEYFVRHEE